MSSLLHHSSPFSPRRPWWGGDLQTLRNYALQARKALPLPHHDSERLVIPLGDGSGDHMVVALSRPARSHGRPLVVLIHGIAGSENSCYMTVAAAYFMARNYPVLRVNLRGAGLSRPFCRKQYHAGSSEDLAAVIAGLDPELTRHGLLPIGFSLGGNILLKLLGTAGSHLPIIKAASVSAPIDLAQSSKSLQRWRNFGYHRFILTRLKRQCTAAGAQLTDDERHAIRGARSLWELDERFTAPRNGYAGAADYYHDNASQAYLGGIRQPTMLIHAKDDPFVPVGPYLQQRWSGQPHLNVLLPASGGHLGFHDPLGLWHLRQIDSFFAAA
ncbi:MAG: alpha/beta fold hydrolase [Alphaproteobacteria bacterium]